VSISHGLKRSERPVIRRRAAGRIVVAALVALAFAGAAGAGAAARPALVREVAAVGLTVADLSRATSFYTRVLGFEPAGAVVETWGEDVERLQGLSGIRIRVARLRLGAETLELTEYLAPRGRPIPADSRSHDRWFQHVAVIVSDMDRAYAWLRRHAVEHASPAPQRLPDWNPAAGGIRAFYFKDPDGHPLEILQFPPGKGDPRWQDAGGRLFLGIDHTAIVVGDTERSLRCYRDALGFRVVGGSENWGPEQERLNNVVGARVRITTLRAAAGPAVEFLEYLTPRDGRPIPPDARPNDLAHWQTVLETADAETAARALAGSPCRLVSSAVARPDPELGFVRGFLGRDPDGHAFQVRER
jgi:catechol 2,3-dioxygenase-like lactoylglutathione lyase family enzyme